MIKSKATLAHLAPHLTPSSRIIMRVDYNVPVKDDKILDLARIKATLPTIQHLLKSTPKSLVLLSHMGRPDGAVNPIYSTKKLIDPLSSLIGKEVKFIDYPAKAQDLKKIDNSQNEIFLCQNVRFNIEEYGYRTQTNLPLAIHKTKWKTGNSNGFCLQLFKMVKGRSFLEDGIQEMQLLLAKNMFDPRTAF